MNNELEGLKDLLGSYSEPDEIKPLADRPPEGATATYTEFSPLRNTVAPQYVIQREKPAHRMVALLRAAMLNCREISELVGLSESAVKSILKQPDTEQLVLEMIHKRGGEALDVLKRAAVDAAEYQVSLLKNNTAKNKERFDASEAILNRVFGKAAQPILNGNISDLLNKSDAELAALLPPTDATATSQT